MIFYAAFCVPETKGVPLESIGLLFEGNIIAGATSDLTSGGARARRLRDHHLAGPNGMRTEEDGGKLADDGEQEQEVGHFEDTRHST